MFEKMKTVIPEAKFLLVVIFWINVSKTYCSRAINPDAIACSSQARLPQIASFANTFIHSSEFSAEISNF